MITFSRWDRLWAKFDKILSSASEQIMQRIKNQEGTAEMIYENGHVELRVKGVFKTLKVNGQEIQVKNK